MFAGTFQASPPPPSPPPLSLHPHERDPAGASSKREVQRDAVSWSSWRRWMDMEQMVGRLKRRPGIDSCVRRVETQGNINKLEM